MTALGKIGQIDNWAEGLMPKAESGMRSAEGLMLNAGYSLCETCSFA